MARNKHPEVTEGADLRRGPAALPGKGVREYHHPGHRGRSGGLTKGGCTTTSSPRRRSWTRWGDRMFLENNPFEAVQGRTDLNALEKLREAIRLNQSDRTRTRWTVQAIPLTYSPRVLLGMIEANRRILTPYYQALLEEGNRDGSLRTDYPRELAELLPPSSPACGCCPRYSPPPRGR